MVPRQEPLRLEEIQSGLVTQRLGKLLRYFPEVDSTNLYARNWAERGGAEGDTVIAETQTAGRGRMGRSWLSPPYMNLYLSILLKPKFPPVDAPQITLMAAVALAETVESFIPVAPEIKWPNDILVGGRKLAGVLTESSCEKDKIRFIVLGIGVNVNFPADVMPAKIRGSATSLMILAGKQVSREAFARRLIHNLDRCYGELEDRGFGSLASRWKAYFRLQGKRVRIDATTQSITGTVAGIDRDGSLLLQDERGKVQKVIAGEVMPLET